MSYDVGGGTYYHMIMDRRDDTHFLDVRLWERRKGLTG